VGFAQAGVTRLMAEACHRDQQPYESVHTGASSSCKGLTTGCAIALHISMTDAALLDHIARLPHARANFKQLVRESKAKGNDRAELELALARLVARGDLIEVRGQYTVTARSRDFAIGRLNMHRDGYGFLISER